MQNVQNVNTQQKNCIRKLQNSNLKNNYNSTVKKNNKKKLNCDKYVFDIL